MLFLNKKHLDDGKSVKKIEMRSPKGLMRSFFFFFYIFAIGFSGSSTTLLCCPPPQTPLMSSYLHDGIGGEHYLMVFNNPIHAFSLITLLFKLFGRAIAIRKF